jgi:hypothetical protein
LFSGDWSDGYAALDGEVLSRIFAKISWLRHTAQRLSPTLVQLAGHLEK